MKHLYTRCPNVTLQTAQQTCVLMEHVSSTVHAVEQKLIAGWWILQQTEVIFLKSRPPVTTLFYNNYSASQTPYM